MPEQIAVTVLFFAGLRERAGTRSVAVALPEGATVADAVRLAQERAPRPWRISQSVMLAVNQEYVEASHTLSDGDELALIPPVSGGDGSVARQPLVTITNKPLDANAVAAQVRDAADGAVLTFEGVTRNHNEGRRVMYLEYEAYRPMADVKIAELIGEMQARWDIDRVAVAHRLGRVDIGETSLVVAVSAAHRQPAFAAALYFVDRLKEVVPIWKKEHFEGGQAWIGERDEPQAPPGG